MPDSIRENFNQHADAAAACSADGDRRRRRLLFSFHASALRYLLRYVAGGDSSDS